MKRCGFVLLNLNISHLALAQEAENDGAVDGAGERLRFLGVFLRPQTFPLWLFKLP